MQFRTLHITLLSAKNLNNVAPSMDVYAVVSISGSKQEHMAPPEVDGGSNPTWNFQMKFKVGETALQTNHLTLDFNLLSEEAPDGDKDVGRLSVSIKELLDSADDAPFVGRVEPEGELTFSHKFSAKSAASASARPPPLSYSEFRAKFAAAARPPPPSGAEMMENVKKTVVNGVGAVNKNIKSIFEMGSDAVKNVQKNKAALFDLLPKKKIEPKFPVRQNAVALRPAQLEKDRAGPSHHSSASKTGGATGVYQPLKTTFDFLSTSLTQTRADPSLHASTSSSGETASIYKTRKTTSDFLSTSMTGLTQTGSGKESGKAKSKPPK